MVYFFYLYTQELLAIFYLLASLFSGAKYFTITISPTSAVPLFVLKVAQERCATFMFSKIAVGVICESHA